jgi:hypothetical protein
MGDAFPSARKQKREALLDDVDKIAPVRQACGANSEELGTLSPETVIASRAMGMAKLKLCTDMGGSEADSVTEMMVLEQFAYLERLFTDGNVGMAATSFFPAGGAVSDRNGCRVSGQWRFNGGIQHAEWVLGGTFERAKMHERYERLYDSVSSEQPSPMCGRFVSTQQTGQSNPQRRATTLAATTGRTPGLLGRSLRDLNIAGFHSVMSDTANENRVEVPLGSAGRSRCHDRHPNSRRICGALPLNSKSSHRGTIYGQRSFLSDYPARAHAS